MSSVDFDELKKITKKFALCVIKLVDTLPNTTTGRIISNQRVRSGTSVGANYRAACRAKSTADFISKMGTVEEEGDESMYWMELLVDSGMIRKCKIDDLYNEADEIVAMVVSSIKTAKKKPKHKNAE